MVCFYVQTANLFAAGDLDGAIGMVQQIQFSRQAAAASDLLGAGPWADGLVNGVHMDVVALALWPAALARQGQQEKAEAALAKVLACAEACPHPLTRCCVLASLCSEYFCVAGDRARGVALAKQAAELAAKHGLEHCGRSGPCTR
jgi:hypothetical protein